MISENIGEMCSIYAKILSEADLLPINFIKTTPGLERAIALCEEMKELSSETLGFIESQGELVMSAEDFDFELQRHQENAEVNFYHEDTGTFVDARSQVSESEESNTNEVVSSRKSLPFLRDPNQKINI